MKVLLTGAAGSIGVHFIAHIMHTTDWQLVGIDSFRHKGEFDRITEVCQDHPDWLPRIGIMQHDLRAPFSERQITKLEHVDYVLHLASLSDVQASIDDPVTTIRNNVDITLNILELAREIRPKVFLQFSTDEIYGPAAIDQAHREWETILPSNPYAASKAAQEAICICYWRSYGVPLIITNTMNNVGEMQQSSKFPVIVQKRVIAGQQVDIHAASDGQIGTRYYLHSRNAADAVLFILQNTEPYLHQPGHIDRPDRYNIVGEQQLSNLELAQMIAKLIGRELKYQLIDFHANQPGHDLHYGLDGSKLADMGWKPPVDFEDSLGDVIKWQTEHPEWLQ